MYDIGTSIGFNSGLHRLVDKIWPLIPVVLLAGALHTNEKTPSIPFKCRACEEVFYVAIAKQGLGIFADVLFRRHANWP